MLYSRGECWQWHRDEWKKKHFALWISPSAYSQHPPLRGRAGSSSNSCSVSSELWAQPSCDPWLLWKVCCDLFAPTGALYIVLCYCRSSVENLFSSSIFTQSIHFPSHWQRLLCVDIWAEIRALAKHTYPFHSYGEVKTEWFLGHVLLHTHTITCEHIKPHQAAAADDDSDFGEGAK